RYATRRCRGESHHPRDRGGELALRVCFRWHRTARHRSLPGCVHARAARRPYCAAQPAGEHATRERVAGAIWARTHCGNTAALDVILSRALDPLFASQLVANAARGAGYVEGAGRRCADWFQSWRGGMRPARWYAARYPAAARSEEHTSELQSLAYLV